MDVAVVLTLVQTFLQLLQSPIPVEITSFWGFDSQLEKLKNTMSIIQAVLTNVEILESQQLPISIPKVTLERLEDAVYEADDLFDELATLANLKELMPGNKLSKEVRLFFSRFNQLCHTFTMSREIRKIRGILDDITKDHREFGKMVPSKVKNIGSSRETGSFVAEEEIIGRDEDKQIVKNFLLDTSLDDTISFVSIVGMGGLGKTALVQLVYNDPRIQKQFSPKIWVCVSDDFNVISLLDEIQAVATNGTTGSGFNKGQLQTQVLEQLRGKKYLLVLDDVWNEDVMKWDDLKRILVQGGKGSRIIVSTRSQRVAEVVGSQRTHVLKGLSDDDSWKLFQKMTLKQQDQMEPHLVNIGMDIVRKCSNVPLAIRFVGSLLQGQDEREWERLHKNDLAQIKQDEVNGIIPVLKMSYNHLPPHLKSCFSYCAVFPKDYKFKKEDLICLWMAQGFVRGLDLEDLAEDYFKMLLQRCFFQDVVYEDEATGNVLFCKMHDLVHDLAIDVSRIKIVESPVNKFGSSWDKKTRHIFGDDTLFKTEEDVERHLSKVKRLLRPSNRSKFYHDLYNLRVLKLNLIEDMKLLPSMIGKMLHLRYLDLSHNRFLCELPNSITQLYNLQILKLTGCEGLKELPRDLSKLVNLRHLDLHGCGGLEELPRDLSKLINFRHLDILGCLGLRHMPGRMNNMKCLHKLTNFVVGDDVRKKAGDVGKLEDVKDLNNLRDSIEIKIKDGWNWRIYDAEKVKEGGYLIHKSLLNKIIIEWDEGWSDDDGDAEWSDDDGDAEALLQGLQPHPNIKMLRLFNYPGVGFPRWGNYSSMMNLAESLPNLVEIFLWNCRRLESLPSLSQLRQLKVLRLSSLTKLEYVESSSSSRNGDNELVFFPFLTELKLRDLPELKGWWKESTTQVEMEATSTAGEGGEIARGDVNQIKNEFLGFPSLSRLHISGCGKLETLPGLPKLKGLDLKECNNTLLDHLHLHSLPESFKYDPPEISIEKDDKMERLSAVEVFRSGRLYSLLSLQINNCRKLKSISGGQVWEHFKALETLELTNLPELELEDNGNGCDDDDEMHMPWRWFAPTLRRLTLLGLDKMVKMPKGIQHLTSLVELWIDFSNVEEIPGWIGCLSSLQELTIRNCSRVKSLPEEMRHLTCLTRLTLWFCSVELKERCKNPTGVDWPKIKHIPDFECYY